MFERPDPWIELRAFTLTKDGEYAGSGVVLPTGQVLVAGGGFSSFGSVERMLMLYYGGATLEWAPELSKTLNLEHELPG